MYGGPWKIRVWYNHGEWNYSLQLGSLNLDPTGCGKYFCLMSDTPGDSGGLPDWTEHSAHGGARAYRDPNKAVANQIKAARRRVNELDMVVRFVEAHQFVDSIAYRRGPRS